MNLDPEIVVHAPLPRPTDEAVGYDAEGESEGGRRKEPLGLDPDPYHVMLRAPEQLLDPDFMDKLMADINEAGATSIHVELGGEADVGPELIQGLRQLGNETGAARIDVHATAG